MSAKLSLIVALVALAAQASGAHDKPVPFASYNALTRVGSGSGEHLRAMNGNDAKQGQFPHQAGIYIDMSTFCGGALIAPKWILTAGTCAGKEPYGSRYTAYLGAQNINLPAEKGRIAVTTTWAYVHEDFDAETFLNDVALLLLPREVKITDYIKPISLPPKSFSSQTFDGSSFHFSGWGYLNDASSSISSKLQYISLTGLSKSACVNAYGYEIYTDNILCCSGANKQSPCKGDTGSALVQQGADGLVHVAVSSFTPSKGCGSGLPSGFTRTASYLDWIASKTGIAITQ